jgi:hypothetical protein
VIHDDDLDTARPCYRVNRKGREMLLGIDRHRYYTYEIIRPDLLKGGKVDLRSTQTVKVAQL